MDSSSAKKWADSQTKKRKHVSVVLDVTNTDTTEASVDAMEDSKPSAKLSLEEDIAWKSVIDRIPRCSAAEGIRETSYFRNKFQPGGGRNACLRKLLQELGSLEESLPSNPAIWLRFDEETPQFLRALVTAPTGTPYALGLFCFDLYIPDTYPAVAPKVRLLTTGGGTVRFSPNLYENGTVCLSLLGTWHGPKWNPLHSTILQVLVSIQGLILGVEHPYYLEPGFGGWEESVSKGATVPPHVKNSDSKIREGTVKFAMLETFKASARYLVPFQDIISIHFSHHKDAILNEVRAWGRIDRVKRSLQKAISQLQEEFEKIISPEGGKTATEETLVAGDDSKSSKKVKENGEDPIIIAKRSAMEEAAGKGDYVTAGQLQSELQYLQVRGVDAMVSTKRSEMEQAASKGDYITAGRLQQRVQYLEQHRRRLQDLPRRMFEAAAKQDYVRAGRFQEQYQILLDSNETTDPKSGASANPVAMWDQGPAAPSYTFFSSSMAGLPVSSLAGGGLKGFHENDDAPPVYEPPSYYEQSFDDGGHF